MGKAQAIAAVRRASIKKAAAEPHRAPSFVRPAHPGEILRAVIESLDVTMTAVAEALQLTRPSVYHLMNGDWGMTATMAVKVSYVFGSTPTFWMNLQRNYDLWEAERTVSTAGLTQLREKR